MSLTEAEALSLEVVSDADDGAEALDTSLLLAGLEEVRLCTYKPKRNGNWSVRRKML